MVVQFVLEQRQIVVEPNCLFAHQLEYVQLGIGVLQSALIVQRTLIVGAERPIVRTDFLLQQLFRSGFLPLSGARYLEVQFTAILDGSQGIQAIEFDARTGCVSECEAIFGENHFGKMWQV